MNESEEQKKKYFMTKNPGSDTSIKKYLCAQEVLNGTLTIQVP